jgi:1,4-alpha-glucan branching enzyme
VKLQHDYQILDDLYIDSIYENNSDKIIAFTRGNLLFVFNFNPVLSFTDYGIPLKGKFSVLIDTDDPALGGFDRFDRKSVYTSLKKAESHSINVPFYLYLYLPSRTALVFKKEPVRKATDI